METSEEGSQAWPWENSLDAMIAAPAYHKLLFENDRVRVLEVRIGVGQVVPLHTHRWSSILYVQSASDFIRRDKGGQIVFDSRNSGPPQEAPGVVWSPPRPPHSVENVGSAGIHIISIELKDIGG